jgi:hypothetical protein
MSMRGIRKNTAVKFSSVDESFIEKHKNFFCRLKKFLRMCPKERIGSYTIPDSVKIIGYAAFFECAGLNQITIPKSVETIESYAFSKCSGLTSITIPNSVRKIGAFALLRYSDQNTDFLG